MPIAALFRKIPAPLWKLLWPLISGVALKGVKKGMNELLMIVLAQALKALRGTPQYDGFVNSVTEALKNSIPGGAIEPELAGVLEDIAAKLKG